MEQLNTACSSSKISVVLITRNRRKELAKTLAKLTAFSVPVIVIDNNSTDHTSSFISQKFPNVILISLSKNLGPVARNIGVKLSKTPYIAFCDDDSFWAKISLTKATWYFDHFPKLGLIQARVLVGQKKKLDPVCQLMSHSYIAKDMPGRAILGFVACGAIVRKKAFEDAGGFGKYMDIGGEETLLATDLISKGWKLTYLNDLTTYHYPSKTRNLSQRQANEIKNLLLFTWLRRRLPSALKITYHLFKKSLVNPNYRRGFLTAVSLLGWVAKNRKEISPKVELQLQALESNHS